jgi:ComF family protein
MKPLARPLARYLERILPEDEHFDAIVPVPLHWRKRWARGFNQSEILSRRLSEYIGIPVVGALRRKRPTATQAGLAGAGRRRNVARAFEVGTGAKLAGAKILLIDDVITTGATASACAVALKRGGAKSVSLLTLARVDRRWRL